MKGLEEFQALFSGQRREIRAFLSLCAFCSLRLSVPGSDPGQREPSPPQRVHEGMGGGGSHQAPVVAVCRAIKPAGHRGDCHNRSVADVAQAENDRGNSLGRISGARDRARRFQRRPRKNSSSRRGTKRKMVASESKAPARYSANAGLSRNATGTSTEERCAVPLKPAYAPTFAGNSLRISDTKALASPKSISVLSM